MSSQAADYQASRRGWDEFTRLACQTRVEGDVVIRRLLEKAQDIVVLDFDAITGGTAGEGKELDLAVLFSDIRVTTLSESSLPYDVVHMLNRDFTAAAEPVLNNNGFIDKYIGDGLRHGRRDDDRGSRELIAGPDLMLCGNSHPRLKNLAVSARRLASINHRRVAIAPVLPPACELLRPAIQNRWREPRSHHGPKRLVRTLSSSGLSPFA
jgi:class 3 adenylate cyclase